MLRILFLFLSLSCTLFSSLSLDRDIHSECVVLINGDTGKVLWAKNPDKVCYPASTTKIATVFYTLLQKPQGLQEKVVAQKEVLIKVSPSEKMANDYNKCPSFWLETDASQVGIKPGEVMTIQDLLFAAMLVSGNDASNVLAQAVSGTVPAFMDQLNGFLKNIGCKNTRFCNPHGHHHPNHVTTARDMARLTQCAMYHPYFRKVVSTLRYDRKATNMQPKTTYVQKNKLLCTGRHYYPYAIGVKTGYTSKAGYALIAAAEKDGRQVIVALLQCKEKDGTWQDAHTLFDAVFRETLQQKVVMPKGDQTFSREYDGGTAPVATYTNEDLIVRYYPSEETPLRCLLEWDELELPIVPNAQVGKMRLIAEDKELAVMPLFAKNGVEEVATYRITRMIGQTFGFVIDHWVIATIAVVAVGLILLRRRLI